MGNIPLRAGPGHPFLAPGTPIVFERERRLGECPAGCGANGFVGHSPECPDYTMMGTRKRRPTQDVPPDTETSHHI